MVGESTTALRQCATACLPACEATAFEVCAERGSTTYGIASNPFLDENFTTTHFRMTVNVNPDGTWTYDQNTRLVLPDRAEPFDHTDRNTLRRAAPAAPNPLARATSGAPGAGSLLIGDLKSTTKEPS